MFTAVNRNALEIINRFRAQGFTAYIVGGAVRDLVMGTRPKDYDIATDASPEDVRLLFRKVLPVGEKFGVSLVVLGGESFEVARFRVDGAYEDGRRPAYIKPSSEIDDVLRRDFTINALLYDPLTDRIIDHVGGLEDIQAGIIRTVGDPGERFSEDRLRMLRAVRFAVRFGFAVEEETSVAVNRFAPHILEVSSERIGEELSKMFTGPHPDRALTLLDETGLLAVVLPEVAAMKGVEQPVEFHPEGDVFEHTRIMLELFGGGKVTLAFGILLHDVGKPVTCTVTDRIRFSGHDQVGADITSQILTRLRFSRAIKERVTVLVKNHMLFMQAKQMKGSTLKRFMAMESFGEMLELYRFDCLASSHSLDVYFSLKKLFEEKRQLPVPLVTGEDLIELGYEPGPLFGTILDAVMDAQLEGTITTREEAVEFVLGKYPSEKVRQDRKRKNNRWD